MIDGVEQSLSVDITIITGSVYLFYISVLKLLSFILSLISSV